MEKVQHLSAEFEALRTKLHELEQGIRELKRQTPESECNGLDASCGICAQLPDPIFIMSPKGQISSCNQAWLTILGYDREDVVDKPFSAFLPADERSSFAAGSFIQQALEKEIPLRLLHKSGSIKELNAMSAMLENDHLLLRLQDLTMVKQLQSIAAQQEKLASVGMLAAGVAHEINNPIGYVSSMLNTLEKYTARLIDLLSSYHQLKDMDLAAPETKATLEDWNDQWKKKKIDFILESLPSVINRSKEGADRVRKIVSDLRTFARTNDEGMTAVDLNNLLEMALNVTYNELKYKAEIVRIFCDNPIIRGNSNKISQVFVNLLVNASHAIEKQGVITVCTKKTDDAVIASIKDTGSGIKEEDLAKIFDPFFTTKPVGQGTGLGLNIAYNIIQQHGGEIKVESMIGQGTTFTLRFPLIKSTGQILP